MRDLHSKVMGDSLQESNHENDYERDNNLAMSFSKKFEYSDLSPVNLIEAIKILSII